MSMLLALLLLADWIAVIPTVEKSIAKLEAQKSAQTWTCTAVIFEHDPQTGMAAALTAAHCVTKEPNERLDLTVSERTAYVVDSNTILDLAVVRYRMRDSEQPIAIATTLPVKGTEVMVVGYPFGLQDIGEQVGIVSQHNKETKTTFIDADLIFGNSGGACVNAQGELVGINSAILSQGPAHLGVIVTLDHVQDCLDSYRARFVKPSAK